MRGCGVIGCGCGFFGLLIQLALLGVTILFVGSVLGVLPEPFNTPGDALLETIAETLEIELPAPVCESFPEMEEFFGRCN